MTVTHEVADPLVGGASPADAQALFEEARRRRRRRYRRTGLVLLLLAGAGVALALSSGGSPERAERPRAPSQPVHHRPVQPQQPAAVAPAEPGPLAMGPNGDLYVVDAARSEILAMSPDGRFQVVAGTGTGGFSGDGGPAVDADLSGPSGMATAPNGVVYFADSRNDRVRALLPNGTITTVVGNGQPAAGWEGTPVLGPTALETAIGTTEAVTMGPDGSLYIAASNAVLKLTDGRLSIVADAQNFLGVDPRYPGASSCDPDGLAFDGSGDLYMTCSDTNDLLEETAGGTFVYRGILRPHDASAALAASPDGTVIGLWQSALYRFTPTTEQQIRDFDTVPGVGDFWPQGVAVASDGTIYLDQDGDSGIGPPSIVAYSPGGKDSAVWAHTETSKPRSSAP